jgi:hypothetical protein
MASSKIKFGGTFAPKEVPKSKLKKITYPGGKPNTERDSDIELTELQKDFKEAARKETKLMADNTNAEFFSVIVFKTQEQRDLFISILNIKTEDNQYIHGEKLIKALELKIDAVNLKDPGKFKCNAEILNLAMDI